MGAEVERGAGGALFLSMSSTSSLSLHSIFHSLAMAGAAGLLFWPWTVFPVLLAGTILCFAGGLAGAFLANRRFPVRVAVAAGLFFFLGGSWFSGSAVNSEALSHLLGPGLLFLLGEILFWCPAMLAGGFLLQMLARRQPMAVFLEIAFVATAVATALGGHRSGQIHRPRILSDWSFTNGLDPALVLLVFGGLTALVMAGLLLRESKNGRLGLQAVLLGLAGAGTALSLAWLGPPAPPSPEGPGLGLSPGTRLPNQGELRAAQLSPYFEGLQPERLDPTFGATEPVAVVLFGNETSTPGGFYYFSSGIYPRLHGEKESLGKLNAKNLEPPRSLPFPRTTFPLHGASSEDQIPVEVRVGLLSERIRPFVLGDALEIWPEATSSRHRFRWIYGLRTRLPSTPLSELLAEEAGNQDWTWEERAILSRAPSDPRYGDLARRIVAALPVERASSPFARALAIRDWLGERGTLMGECRAADRDDPMGSFLFRSRKGHSLFFAQSAALLLRSLGLPSRVVTGYAVPESRKRQGSTLLLRGADARAWCEIYLAGAGWVPIDPRPKLGARAPAEPDWELQTLLGELLLQELRAEVPESAGLPPPFSFPAGIAILLRLAGLLFLGIYGIKFFRRWRPFFRSGRIPFQAYRAALDALAETGIVRRDGESRERFAQRVADFSPSFPVLTEIHLAAALGSRKVPEPAGRVRSLLLAVHRELQGPVSGGRRLLRLLDPFSWARSR